jgi:hypothetical protein
MAGGEEAMGREESTLRATLSATACGVCHRSTRCAVVEGVSTSARVPAISASARSACLAQNLLCAEYREHCAPLHPSPAWIVLRPSARASRRAACRLTRAPHRGVAHTMSCPWAAASASRVPGEWPFCGRSPKQARPLPRTAAQRARSLGPARGASEHTSHAPSCSTAGGAPVQ